MFRRTSLPWLFLLISTSSWASWIDNVYIGAGLGPAMADFHQAARIIHSTPEHGIDSNISDNEHHAAFGYFGSAFVGIERNFCDKNLLLHLAGEINADISEVEFHSNNNEFFFRNFSSTSYKLRYNVGVSFLPGFWFQNNTLFYARLGYALAHFRVSTADSSLKNLSRDLNGFRYGLGIERTLCDGLSIRMDYNRTEYQTTRMQTLDPNSLVAKKTVISPTAAEVMFAVVYRFC